MKKSSKDNTKIQLPLFGIKNFHHEALLYRVIPRIFLDLLGKYFRLKVEGGENVPRDGRAIICPNHSGYAGIDALILANEIRKSSGRIPRVLTHHLWFLTKSTAIPANKLGFIEATATNGIRCLLKNQLVVLFPEGEYGNFKPTSKAYRLQEFKRGFVRMALLTKAPIIPVVVIGAEETHINLSRLRLPKALHSLILPLPLNLIPLPAKWKIRFLEPIYLPYKAVAADDRELVHDICLDIQERMQKAINHELAKRKSIFV
ncbi:MAG: acyltransferase family protein [Bdellovibrionales bacterium]|nr:acyltransferase family protein [Bdellovibrionales bacterium]